MQAHDATPTTTRRAATVGSTSAPAGCSPAIRDAVVVADADTGDIALWNPAAVELFGFSSEAVLGRAAARAPGRPRAHAALARPARRSSAAPDAVELFARRHDGAEICVELTLSRIDAEREARSFVVAVIRDVVRTPPGARRAHRATSAPRSPTRNRLAAQRRLAVLAEASKLLDASLDYEATLQEVARVAVRTMADWCIVHLLEAGRHHPLAGAGARRSGQGGRRARAAVALPGHRRRGARAAHRRVRGVRRRDRPSRSAWPARATPSTCACCASWTRAR